MLVSAPGILLRVHLSPSVSSLLSAPKRGLSSQLNLSPKTFMKLSLIVSTHIQRLMEQDGVLKALRPQGTAPLCSSGNGG